MIEDDTINGLDKDEIPPELCDLIHNIQCKFNINEKVYFVITDDGLSGPNMNVQHKYKFKYRLKKDLTLCNVLKITRGMFKIMNLDEIINLIAHEFGHIKNKDESELKPIIWVFALLAIISGLAGAFEIFFKYDHFIIILTFVIFVIIIIMGKRKYNSKMRSMETRADIEAVTVMQNPDTFISALNKLDDSRKAKPEYPICTNLRRCILCVVGRTHPSYKKRIDDIESWKEQIQ